VIRKVRGGMMPRRDAAPDGRVYDELVGWLEGELDRAAAAAPNPGGPIRLHRLNRAEYGNAIRDLLARDVDVTSLLPADDSAYGFDNIGDVLGVSPMLMERYLSAAWKVSGLAVGNTKATPTVETFRVRSDLSQNDHIEGQPIARGGILVRYTFQLTANTSSSAAVSRDGQHVRARGRARSRDHLRRRAHPPGPLRRRG
jgi:hypothetical protein